MTGTKMLFGRYSSELFARGYCSCRVVDVDQNRGVAIQVKRPDSMLRPRCTPVVCAEMTKVVMHNRNRKTQARCEPQHKIAEMSTQ